MSIEYFGWMALSTSHDEWGDDDFDTAWRAVREILPTLDVEDGHEAIMPEPHWFPKTVYLKGTSCGSITPATEFMKRVLGIFDKAWGELVVLDNHGDTTLDWDFSRARRYRLADGELKEQES